MSGPAKHELSLFQKQTTFAQLVGELLFEAHRQGFDVTLGEAFRTAEQAEWNAEHGIGIQNSLHGKRLAIDLNLFHGSKYLTSTADYEPLGVWWERQSGNGCTCTWGGRFSDGGHFSVAYGGRK